jgi:excinuclease ABC subunit C
LRPDDLRHAAYAPAPAAVCRALRAHVRATVEDRPGVYRMLGATGLVLYVGKSHRLRTRLLGYLRAATKNRRRDKEARILRYAHAVEWEYTSSEFAALLRELRLIKQHRPRFNVAMNVDEAPRGWLGVTAGPLPGLRVILRTDDPGAESLYGPFRRVGMLHEATRALADACGLRDCESPSRPAGCLRHGIGSCAAPCLLADPARPDRAFARDYAARVAEARAFLAGRTTAPVERLRADMLRAAEEWHFERAGSLKARVEALAWLADRLSRFHAGADRLSFVYRALGHDGTERVYLVRRGTVRAELDAPRTARELAELARLTRRVFEGPDPTGGDIPTHDMDEFYLIASWFRRRPAELARVTRVRAGDDSGDGSAAPAATVPPRRGGRRSAR